MKHKIAMLRKGKKIFQMIIRFFIKGKPRHSNIMLDAGKGLYVGHAILGKSFKHYKSPEFEINSLSWHGYYKIIDDQQLYSPVVHAKRLRTKIDRPGYFGSINEFAPLAFPVCSIYHW